MFFVDVLCLTYQMYVCTSRYHFQCVDLPEDDAEDISESSLRLSGFVMTHCMFQDFTSARLAMKRRAYIQSVSI